MTGKAPNMQLLGETLTRNYRLACELYNTFPVGRSTHQLSQGKLSIDLSNLDHDHLEAICHILQNKITPVVLDVCIPPTTEVGARMIQQAIRGISACVAQSVSLTTLELFNIELRGNNLESLCQGLLKSRNIKSLNISKCNLRDSGVERLCQGIKNIPSISSLSLVDCGLSEKGAEVIAGLLKHQRLNRDSAMWQDTLRLRHPHLDGMRGLRRITLNNNPQLGDGGSIVIAEALSEDLWIKALDLQHCGIGSEGCLSLKNILKMNHTLEVVDLRRNPFIPSHLVDEVINLLNERQDEYNPNKYDWLDLTVNLSKIEKEKVQMEDHQKILMAERKSLKKKAKKPSEDSLVSLTRAPSIPKKHGIPWRIEHRIYERREGLKPGSFVDISVMDDTINESTPQDKDFDSQKEAAYLRKVKKFMIHYKHLYRKEKEARKRLERKLANLRTKIAKSHLLDEETICHIETCFQKFQAFLITLKTAGFQWQAGLWETINTQDIVMDRLNVEPFSNSPDHHSPEGNENCSPTSISTSDMVPVLIEDKLQHKSLQQNHSNSEADFTISDNDSPDPLVDRKTQKYSNDGIRLHSGDRNGNILKELEDDIEIGRNLLSPVAVIPEKDEALRKPGRLPAKDSFGNISMAKSHSFKESHEPIECTREDQSGDNKEIEFDMEDDISDGKESIENSKNLKSQENVFKSKISSYQNDEREVKNIHSSDFESETTVVGVIGTASKSPNIKLNITDAFYSQAHKATDSNINYNEDMPISLDDIKSQDPVLWGSSNKVHKCAKQGNNSEIANNKNVSETLLHESRKENNKLQFQKSSGKDKLVMSDANPSEVVETNLCSHRSETDDEKLQLKKTIRLRGRNVSGSSSLSITEHLSHSHSSWTGSGNSKTNAAQYRTSEPAALKNVIAETVKLKEVNSDVRASTPKMHRVDYESDFEVSDIEGLSISASSLTSTTIPDDLVTPGEEDF